MSAPNCSAASEGLKLWLVEGASADGIIDHTPKPRRIMTRSSSAMAAWHPASAVKRDPRSDRQVLVIWLISSLESFEVAMATPVSR